VGGRREIEKRERIEGGGKDSREEGRHPLSIKSWCPHNCFFKVTYFAVAIVVKAR
jgi:hypothetical protein